MTTSAFDHFGVYEIQNLNLTPDKAVISYDSVRRDSDSLQLLILCRTVTSDRLLL